MSGQGRILFLLRKFPGRIFPGKFSTGLFQKLFYPALAQKNFKQSYGTENPQQIPSVYPPKTPQFSEFTTSQNRARIGPRSPKIPKQSPN